MSEPSSRQCATHWGSCPQPEFPGFPRGPWAAYRRCVALDEPGMIASLALWAWFAGWAIALSIVDIKEHRLPNKMVAAALAGTLLLATVAAAANADPWLLLRAAAASVVAVLAFGIGHLIGGMGMGDVKYAAVTGLALGTLGWSAVWWGHLLGFVLAGGVVVVGLLTGRMHRRSAVPFGPFMALGAILIAAPSLVSTLQTLPV
jgi:leader peptidase (prepilin peptidase)/N-methyltransferase